MIAFGAFEQRIVHVGDVLDVGHLVAGVEPGPHQQIPSGEGSRVP